MTVTTASASATLEVRTFEFRERSLIPQLLCVAAVSAAGLAFILNLG
jgi:hypothetical protein